MSQFVAFIRAINVGGHAVVKMDDLKAAFVSAGCDNVRTFIASGNVIFEANSATIQKKVLSKLRDLIGREPTVMFRTLPELESLTEDPPYRGYKSHPEAKSLVVFVDRRMRQKPKLPLRSEKEGVEVIGMADRDIYAASWRKPNGYPGYPNDLIEKEFGVLATTRAFSTVTKILDLMRMESAAMRDEAGTYRKAPRKGKRS